MERNLAALRKSSPHLAKCLDEGLKEFNQRPQHLRRYQFVDYQGHKNLSVFSQEHGKRFLYHAENPKEEARHLLEQEQVQNASVLVIFGFGMGHVLKEFLANRPHTNFSVLIIEKEPEIFFTALSNEDFTAELSDDTIQFIVGFDTGEIDNFLIDYFIGHTTIDRHLKIVASPMALGIDHEFYSKMTRSILDTRDHCVLLVGNSVNDQFLGFENTMDNLDLVLRNPGLERLRDQFKGKLCLSVAAGPSVSEHWDLIKEVQGKIPIIACDTVLKPMSDRGIYADFYTALERDDYVPRLFRNIYVNERSSLVAPMLLMRESFDCYKGEKIIYTPSPLYTDSLKLNFLGRFHPGSSAGNLNVTLAAYMGFSTCIMIGHNLAYGYDSAVTHVAGTIDPDRERPRNEEELKSESRGLRVATMDGESEVATRIEWNYFRKQMEQSFVTHKDRVWINTAAKGARIKGTTLMTAREAIEKYHTEDFDIEPEKRRLLAPVSESEFQIRKSEMLQAMKTTADSLSDWRLRAEKMLSKIAKLKTKIQDKELDGKRVSIDSLNEAIDEVLDIKVKAVNEDRAFYMTGITILMPFHATFERVVNQMRLEYKDDYSLKRDFLLKHEQYFEGWLRHLPRIEKRLRGALERWDLSTEPMPEHEKSVETRA